MLSSKILFVFAVGPRQVDRALALDLSQHFRHRLLGRTGKQHVNVVRHQVAFQNPAILLARPHGERPLPSAAVALHKALGGDIWE